MATDTGSPVGFRRLLTAADAARLTRAWLAALLPAANDPATDLMPFLLQLAAQRTYFQTILRRARLAVSASLLGQRWRRWRAAHSLDAWEQRLDAALRAPWQAVLRGEAVVVIVDEHAVPYWGKISPTNDGEVRRSLAQSGTTRFFVYATAALLWRGIRLQVAVTRVRVGDSHAAVFARLHERVQTLGVRVVSWVMDKGFFGADVVAAVGDEPYLIAAPRRGEKEGIAALLTQLEAQYGFREARPPDLQRAYTVTPRKKSHAPQSTTVIVGWEPVQPAPQRRRQGTLRRSTVKAGQRWRAIAWISGGRRWSAQRAQRLYAPRTGFESGYRLSKGSRGRTTSRDPKWRLFLFWLSLLLQNAWIWLLIEGKRTRQRHWKQLRKQLPFVDICSWIAHEMELRVGYRWAVDLPGV
jgi:hypothetical protein